MSYRYMRVIVFFDLPTKTLENQRQYRSFRKLLLKNGFIMMQESVYVRLAINLNNANQIATMLKNQDIPEGLVQVLTVTEKQFSKMIFLSGEFNTDILNTDEKVVFI